MKKDLKYKLRNEELKKIIAGSNNVMSQPEQTKQEESTSSNKNECTDTDTIIYNDNKEVISNCEDWICSFSGKEILIY